MKGKLRKIFQGMVVLVIGLGLTGGLTESVQAATCTWNGSVSVDWTNPSNWTDCGVPGVSDNVVIPAATTYCPTIPTNLESFYTVASITIDSGATLTIMKSAGVNAATWTINGSLIANAVDSPIYINFNGGTGSGVVNNNGTITKLGDDNLFMYSTFNNSGDLIFQESGTSDGGVVLLRGGNHTGTFQGKYLFLGGDFAGQTYNFNSGSAIQVTQLFAQSGTVNIEGSYSPPVSASYLSVHPSEGTVTVNFKNGASVIRMAETTIINNGGKLTLEAQAYNYTMEKLSLEYGGELQNLGDLTVNNKFDWNGKLSGVNGRTTINSGTVFTMGISPSTNDFTLDGHNLVNNAVANWNNRNLTLLNSAVIENNGTFNANATTTMSAGATESFINNGNFYKNTASTTTTMNVPFTNNGIVQVNAGSLVFQQGMDNGDNTTINLGGGILDPGETLILESGDSLIGSGTLDSNLVNTGTVSPGASPGIITVDGDYTQDSSGALAIELDGTTPGSGYDQLAVTGAATLGGTLDVSLIPGFTPTAGQSFAIMTYASHTGEFDTLNLPSLSGDLEWKLEYGSTAFLLSIPSSVPNGSITGTISCAGSLSGSPYGVYVDLHSDPLTAPVDTVHISCGDVYLFDEIPDGSYYVGAWLDENESGGGPPDPGEPHAWYGAPDAIVISGGNTITEIDITLEAPFFIYLPSIVR